MLRSQQLFGFKKTGRHSLSGGCGKLLVFYSDSHKSLKRVKNMKVFCKNCAQEASAFVKASGQVVDFLICFFPLLTSVASGSCLGQYPERSSVTVAS